MFSASCKGECVCVSCSSVLLTCSGRVLLKCLIQEYCTRMIYKTASHSSRTFSFQFTRELFEEKCENQKAVIEVCLSAVWARASAFRSAGIRRFLQSPPIVNHVGHVTVLWQGRMSQTYFATGKHLTEAHFGVGHGHHDFSGASPRLNLVIYRWNFDKCREVLGASQTAATATSVCTQLPLLPLGQRIEPQDMEDAIDATLVQLDSL